MTDRQFTVTIPTDIAARPAAVEDVTTFVGDAIRHQVRREALVAYLSDCEAAALAPPTTWTSSGSSSATTRGHRWC